MLLVLLDNATRYTPEKTPIEIVVRLQSRSVIFDVIDHGPGVPPGSEKLVFEKFHRGANAVTDGSRGTGLGLTICRAIVQAHGGEIGVENLAVGGARFWFTIPLGESPPTMLPETAVSTV